MHKAFKFMEARERAGCRDAKGTFSEQHRAPAGNSIQDNYETVQTVLIADIPCPPR